MVQKSSLVSADELEALLSGAGTERAAAVNFLFDGFTVYTQVLSYPAPLSTFFLMLRFFAMYMVFQHFRNAGRIPPKHDRWNLLLPWKKPADSSAP